jgi:hypothetical protein
VWWNGGFGGKALRPLTFSRLTSKSKSKCLPIFDLEAKVFAPRDEEYAQRNIGNRDVDGEQERKHDQSHSFLVRELRQTKGFS